MIGGRSRGQIGIGLRRRGMFAGGGESCGLFLTVGGRFHRLDEAAAGGEAQRGSRAECQPWTSKDRCHTLPFLEPAK
jgi:hypothetical protein